MSGGGLALLLRRAMRRQPRATTVTVTRVVGTPPEPGEEPVPEVVVVKTEEPEKDTTTVKLVRLTFTVSAVTLGVVTVYVAFRVLRYEWRERLETGVLK